MEIRTPTFSLDHPMLPRGFFTLPNLHIVFQL